MGREAKVRWGLVLLGLTIPWLVYLGVEIYHKPHETSQMLREFPSLLFASGYNLFLVGVINAVPFACVAVLDWLHGSGARPLAKRAGMVGATAAVLTVSLLLQLSVWNDAYAPHPSSTAVIGLMFVPIYGIPLLIAGYAAGWLVGKAVDAVQRRK